jgi:D-alanyl-D-alanine carboxypeptidase (penicillin-binding protein 5/6)
MGAHFGPHPSEAHVRGLRPDAHRAKLERFHSMHRPFSLIAVFARSGTAARALAAPVLALTLALSALVPGPAIAQVPAPQLAARSWLLLDATSGQVLTAFEPDMKIEPASLTKLMTAHLVFEAIEENRLSLEQRPPVSHGAWKAIGSRMFVDPAKPASVEELLHGVIIQSGNDASIILAEAVAGTELAFAELMNREARRLGMKNTNFVNATGLPDPEHYTTARDLALLAMEVVRDHPKFYPLYAEKEYTYNNIRQPNRNRLLFVDPSVDGLKTGHTEAAGYCLIASALREQPGADFQRRLVSVVLGSSSEATRAIESQKLLNWGFQNFDAVRVQAKDEPSGEYEVWKGSADTVHGGLEEDLVVTVPRGQAEKVKGEVERIQPLVAPISQGERIGTLRVTLDGQVVAERPLVALESVEPAGWFGRTWDSLRLMFMK